MTINTIITFFQGYWRYLVIITLVIIGIYGFWSYSIRKADEIAFNRAKAECQAQIAQQQLEIQQKTINVTTTAKVIAKVNSNRELDDLISGL